VAFLPGNNLKYMKIEILRCEASCVCVCFVTGWFPAKFVELLDERSKQYSCAGDDSVSEVVTDLVRGTLCPAIKQVLEHGMKRPNFLGELFVLVRCV